MEQNKPEIPAEELLFFNAQPTLLPIYLTLREELEKRCSILEVRTSKTQISFRNRYGFACVSLPRARGNMWPRTYLLVSFGLGYRKTAERILQAVEAAPGRWTHHVPVERPEGVDEELLGWLGEAYRFSMEK